MKATKYVVEVGEKSPIKEIDRRTADVVNGVYNSILDRDPEIEQLYNQWNSLLKKRRQIQAEAKEKIDNIYRSLLLNGIDPEKGLPAEAETQIRSITAETEEAVAEINLAIAEIRLSLEKKGLDPRRFSPSMRTVRFRFART